MRALVDFPANRPVEVALAFAEGKIVEGRFGDRVMYSLQDPPEHVMFLDLGVAQKINLLEPAVGERFQICKRKGGDRGAQTRWDVWLSPEAEKARAAKEAGIAVKDGRPAWGSDRAAGAGADAPTSAPVETATITRPVLSPTDNADHHCSSGPSRPQSKLEDALKTVVAAAHAATEYARSIGYAMPLFSSEDLRVMTNTLMIQDGGGK